MVDDRSFPKGAGPCQRLPYMLFSKADMENLCFLVPTWNGTIEETDLTLQRAKRAENFGFVIEENIKWLSLSGNMPYSGQNQEVCCCGWSYMPYRTNQASPTNMEFPRQ